METKQQTSSVIAKLMGLDEFPLQQPIRRPQRVLSEKYLQKTASIGLREKRSIKESRSHRLNTDKHREAKDIAETPGIVKNQQNIRSTPVEQVNLMVNRAKTGLQKNSREIILRSLQKLENGFVTDSYGDFASDYLLKLLTPQPEVEDSDCQLSTRIVVLKPNKGKTKSAFTSSSLVGSEMGAQKQELSSKASGELFDGWKKTKRNDSEPSKPDIGVSRVTAKGKQIIRKKGLISNSCPSDISTAEVTCDEPHTRFLSLKDRKETTYSSSTGSLFASEAKKRLLERWKTTKDSQENGTSSQGCTLGEVLSIPDLEVKPRTLNCKVNKHGQFVPNAKSSESVNPLGISSKEELKDEFVTNAPWSRNFHASRNAMGFRSRTKNEARSGRCLPLEELVAEGREQKRFEDYNPKPRDVKFTSKKIHPASINMANDHTAQDRKMILVGSKNNLEGKHATEEKLMVSESPICKSPFVETIYKEETTNLEEKKLSGNFENNSLISNSVVSVPVSTVTDVVATAETEDSVFFPQDTSKQQSGSTACNYPVKEGESSASKDASSGQLQESPVRSYNDGLVCPNLTGIAAEFPKSLGEANQPSPSSVLEPPFKEDNSSGSECCENASTDLHGLWMQLQLFKSESEENLSECEILVSSDGDDTEKSFNFRAKDKKSISFFGAEESRDFSYLVDVLEESGFHGGIVEINFEKWHSPESLTSPSVFETLEKKYGDQISWGKAERRLLFDRINSGLMDILRPCIDIHINWKQMRKKMNTMLRRDVVEEELWNLLLTHEKEVSKELSEKALGKEKWLELEDEVDFIAREIEIFLFDELAEEFVSV